MPVIGMLNILSPATATHLVAAFHEGLKETGHIEGQNLAIEFRWADGQYGKLPGMASDLVNRRVAAIYAVSPPAALAAKAATTEIPIVFLSGLDPVKAGLVASLSLPGGNITGVSLITSALGIKRLEILRELIPKALKITVLVNPSNQNTDVQLRDIEAAARSSEQQFHILNATSESEIDAAFAILAEQRPDALMVGADPFFTSRRWQIVALAARLAIPAIYDWREYAFAGGLLSYGTSLTAAYRQAGIYIGKILRGARPAELPVVQSSSFELIINLKTAKSLGLTVPRILLARADQVIE
jgi:putative ABC transport system substrate-binding protein